MIGNLAFVTLHREVRHLECLAPQEQLLHSSLPPGSSGVLGGMRATARLRC